MRVDLSLRAALGVALAAPLLVTTGCKDREGSTTAPLRIAAAADLAFAFKELGDRYAKTTARKVVLSFGSTGLLEKQIADGAPYDVFAAANVSFADDAIASGACVKSSKVLYATGRIVLYTPAGPPPQPKTMPNLAAPP